MSFQELVTASQKYFPDLRIKYKDQSFFMKALGKLLFFNKKFMTSYTTTIGSTVYFPSQSFIKTRPISAEVVLMHELVHVKDSKKYGRRLFSFLYLSPQILFFLCLPLLLLSWKVAILLMMISLLPLPSFFRMFFEKRAYMASLYVLNALGKKLDFDPKLNSHCEDFSKQFKNSTYYFMWIFSGIDKVFKNATRNIEDGNKPFEDPVFDILDDLINSA